MTSLELKGVKNVSNEVGDLELGELDDPSSRYGSFSSLRTSDIALLESNNGHEVPQGRHLGVFSTLVLFISRIIGSGIFATPSSIFVNSGGNAVIFLTIWFLAALMAFAGLYLFLEFGCLIPRSGGRKTFLEAAFNKPTMMVGATMTSFTVLTGMSVSNAIVFGKYVLYGLGFDPNYVNSESMAGNYVGAVCILIIVAIHGVSVKRGVQLQNLLGGLKISLIIFMTISGIYALCLKDPFNQGTSVFIGHLKRLEPVSSSSLTTAFIQAFFCFAGWDSVHAVTSEVKNPTRTLKIAGPLALFGCLACYLSLNFAYLKMFTYEEFKEAGPLAGSILFSKLFGEAFGRKFMTLSVALSSGSNLMVVIYGLSRMNQEAFREGLLPFSKMMASNKPFGAPFLSLICCGILSVLWLCLLPPAGSAYNYLIAMEGYANQIFLLLVAVGLLVYRKKNPDKKADIRASTPGIIFLILFSAYLVVGPFWGDQLETSLPHMPQYQITSLLMILLCISFWFLKFQLIPRVCGYKLKSKWILLDDGLTIKKWEKC
ncbi:LAMI_0D13256g1_1 [Lachancea mirantina]|uniref:LAMI_0D13256g1_1 n=1 Tax=Lachancea mirantina TaxID=1230905 RepID=A0A1G4JG86_9SACH|nr:LAMI_0D13256g1_1 [Lachancea mirantina]